MTKIRVYVDTSVFGGVNDEVFSEASRLFFAQVVSGKYTVLISPNTVEELEAAPEYVRQTLRELPKSSLEWVELDDEVLALADAYIQEGVLSAGSHADALHVAAASVASADLVLSWNFRHIVRYDRVRMFNGVNALRGYRPLDIRSPLEVVYGQDEEL